MFGKAEDALEISNGRTHWTDPEKAWVSNSSIAIYLGVRW